MIAEAVNPATGRCDRCGRHRHQLHPDPLGYICAPCYLGNPDNPRGTPAPTTEQEPDHAARHR